MLAFTVNVFDKVIILYQYTGLQSPLEILHKASLDFHSLILSIWRRCQVWTIFQQVGRVVMLARVSGSFLNVDG